jgi:tripartite-type tricarboxylate transporter receptor subunit TctC
MEMLPAMRPMRLLFAAAIAAMSASGPAAAQSWPDRPIIMVVTFPAGGPSDAVARVLAAELDERLQQRVIVHNRAGAAGTNGAASVATAEPDGYTLLLSTSGPLGYYPMLYKTLGYDPAKAFTPVATIGTVAQTIIVSPKLPVRTLGEFIAFARANAGRVNIGDSGAGTTLHILAAQLGLMAGVAVQHLHYRGAVHSVGDVMDGQIEAAMTGFTPAFAKAKVLAVTATERLKVLPQVPTFREEGIDIVSGMSLTLAAPAGTPPEIVARLNAITNDFLTSERGRSFETSYAFAAVGGTPAAAQDFLARETARIAPVIRRAKIRVE